MLTGYDKELHAHVEDEEIDVSVAAIREAIDGGEIGPWFQPQVELGNGKPVAVEALARWRRADGRIVRPQHFIPLIEREGLVGELTDHMLVQACRWKHYWDQRGLRLNLAINVSPQTLADESAADRFQDMVRKQGVEPNEVVLEITESSVMADAARGLGVLARLRLKGFGLSIDDFGTGYSSLAQLSQIPFTELKIDQGFVSGAPSQPRKRAVIEASLDLARKLDLDVVAEGVETVEEWQMLAELGCGLAQGNLIAQPVPGNELAKRWGAGGVRCTEVHRMPGSARGVPLRGFVCAAPLLRALNARVHPFRARQGLPAECTGVPRGSQPRWHEEATAACAPWIADESDIRASQCVI